MVYVTSDDGKEKKFACLKCIKGHRSSKCNHSNRELFEIKKKGRPVSQCESCRQLRKTKQIHIKCMCHLDIKLEDALNDKSQSMFRHSELSNGGKQAKAPVDVAQRTTNVTLASSCPVCDRPSLYCNCKRVKQELDSSGNSSSGSDGSVTPPVYGLKRNSAGLNTILPVLRHLTIPIHDPSDDIDSDTPIYKSHEEVISDKSAVLGEFTNTSSEDLLNQIYSGFITDKKTPSSSPLLLKEADHQLAELSKDT